MIDQLVQKLAKSAGCTVYPSHGQPRTSRELPEDLQRFYALCGGVSLFESSTHPLFISSPEDFVPSNEVLVGALAGDDPSDNWYVLAKSGGEQVVSIDLNTDNLGRCYDSFWDRHAIVGSCSVIALSFSDFLRRAIESNGSELYWLSPKFTPLGDAYD